MPRFPFISLSNLLAGIVVVLGIGLCVMQIPPRQPALDMNARGWHPLTLPSSSAYPLQPPLLIGNVLLWRDLEDAMLHAYSLDKHTDYPHDWLQGTPERWTATAIEEDIQLLWSNDQLWTARLTGEGGQRSASILVAETPAQGLQLLPLPEMQLAALWQAEEQLQIAIIDSRGRPRFPIASGVRVQRFSAIPSDEGLLLAWVDGEEIRLGELRFTADFLSASVTNIRVLSQLNLQAGEILHELHLYRLEGAYGVLWGVQAEDRPDAVRYRGARVLLNSDRPPQFFAVALPNDPPLRWMQVVGDQLSLSAYIDGIWQPIVIQVGAEGAEGYRTLEGAPVNGSGITFDGNTAAWLSLDAAGLPSVYVTTQVGLSPNAPDQSAWTLWAGLRYTLLGLAWWGVSMVLWGMLVQSRFQLAGALAAYWGSKALVHFGLFSTYPAVLADSRLLPWAAGGIILLLISIISFLLATIGWRRANPIYRYTTYCLTDLILTFAILGASVEWTRLTGG